jgi:hypothetical protein
MAAERCDRPSSSLSAGNSHLSFRGIPASRREGRAFHHCRSKSGNSFGSITLRSLRPFDCSMRMMFCALSICLTLSRTISLARPSVPLAADHTAATHKSVDLDSNHGLLVAHQATEKISHNFQQAALPRSSASLSSGDEVPHIFTRKSRVQPKEILMTSAKGLLQQNLPLAD